MKPPFEGSLIEVWRQTFAENAKVIVLGTERYSILRTAKRKLRQVDFQFDGQQIRGLEQNPDTKSRWAAMARDGSKVMQFLVEGQYVGVVVDGDVRLYHQTARNADKIGGRPSKLSIIRFAGSEQSKKGSILQCIHAAHPRICIRLGSAQPGSFASYWCDPCSGLG